MATVGEKIRALREAAGLTQKQLAELAKLSNVAMIECGYRRGQIRSLERIAKALGVEMADLFDRREEARR